MAEGLVVGIILSTCVAGFGALVSAVPLIAAVGIASIRF